MCDHSPGMAARHSRQGSNLANPTIDSTTKANSSHSSGSPTQQSHVLLVHQTKYYYQIDFQSKMEEQDHNIMQQATYEVAVFQSFLKCLIQLAAAHQSLSKAQYMILSLKLQILFPWVCGLHQDFSPAFHTLKLQHQSIRYIIRYLPIPMHTGGSVQ